MSITDSATDKFSAGEQGLGYAYQPRLALLQLLQLPANTAVFLEKDDDLRKQKGQAYTIDKLI